MGKQSLTFATHNISHHEFSEDREANSLSLSNHQLYAKFHTHLTGLRALILLHNGAMSDRDRFVSVDAFLAARKRTTCILVTTSILAASLKLHPKKRFNPVLYQFDVPWDEDVAEASRLWCVMRELEILGSSFC